MGGLPDSSLIQHVTSMGLALVAANWKYEKSSRPNGIRYEWYKHFPHHPDSSKLLERMPLVLCDRIGLVPMEAAENGSGRLFVGDKIRS